MQDTTDDDVLLTVKEVSRLLSVSVPTVWRLIGARKIPTVLVGQRGRRIKKSDLEAYIESRREVKS